MSRTREEKLRDAIEFREDRMERYHDTMDNVDPEQIGGRWYSMGLTATSLGVYYTGLHDVSEARKWFAEAAQCFLKRVELGESGRANVPGVLMKAVRTALLSADDVVIADVVEEVEGLTSEFLEDFPDAATSYLYIKLLAAIVDEDFEAAEVRAQQFHGASDTLGGESRNRWLTRANFLTAIVEDDADEASFRLGELAEMHANSLGSESGLDDEIMDVEATALARLARQQGVDVEISSEFVPESLVAGG